MHTENEPEKFIQIPWTSLKSELLEALIEEFILREGTDYGVQEVSLEKKKSQILNQIKKEHVLIFFNTEIESCNLVRKEELKNARIRN